MNGNATEPFVPGRNRCKEVKPTMTMEERLTQLEKRVAALEGQLKAQPKFVPYNSDRPDGPFDDRPVTWPPDEVIAND